MPFTFQKALLDLPQFMDLGAAIVTMVNGEATATTFADRQKLSEPVQEKLAALIDTIKAQAAQVP